MEQPTSTVVLIPSRLVAVRLGISRFSLNRLRKLGLIKGIRYSSKKWMFEETEVERFLAAARAAGEVKKCP